MQELRDNTEYCSNMSSPSKTNTDFQHYDTASFCGDVRTLPCYPQFSLADELIESARGMFALPELAPINVCTSQLSEQIFRTPGFAVSGENTVQLNTNGMHELSSDFHCGECDENSSNVLSCMATCGQDGLHPDASQPAMYSRSQTTSQSGNADLGITHGIGFCSETTLPGSTQLTHRVYETSHSGDQFFDRLPAIQIPNQQPELFTATVTPESTFQSNGAHTDSSFPPDDLLEVSSSKRQKMIETPLSCDSNYGAPNKIVPEHGSTIEYQPNHSNTVLPTLRSLLEANTSENGNCTMNSYEMHPYTHSETLSSELGHSALGHKLSGPSQTLDGDPLHQSFYTSHSDESLTRLTSGACEPANFSALSTRAHTPSKESCSLSEQESDGKMSPDCEGFLSFTNEDTQTSMINRYGNLCLSETANVTSDSPIKSSEHSTSQSYSLLSSELNPNEYMHSSMSHGTESATETFTCLVTSHETPHVSYSVNLHPTDSGYIPTDVIQQPQEPSTQEYNVDRGCSVGHLSTSQGSMEALHPNVGNLNEQRQGNANPSVTSNVDNPLMDTNHFQNHAVDDWICSTSSGNVRQEPPHPSYTQSLFESSGPHSDYSLESNQTSFPAQSKPPVQGLNPGKKSLHNGSSKPHSSQLIVTRKVRAPLVYRHSNCILRTDSSLRDSLNSPSLTVLPGITRKVNGLLNGRDRPADASSRAQYWNAANSLQYARFVSQASGRGIVQSIRPLPQFTQGRKRSSRFAAPVPQLPPVLNAPYSRKKCTPQGDDAHGGFGGLPISLASVPSAPSPHQFFPDYSVRHQVRVVIVRQPEAQHRARYQTEGSRGAVKDNSGNGYPTVQLLGWNGRAALQVFVGTEHGRTRPHPFYQAYLVAGKSTKYCVQTIRDGVNVIEMSFSNANNWTLSVECVGILKLRKTDVEQRIQAATTTGSTCPRNRGSDDQATKPLPTDVPRPTNTSKPSGVCRKPGKARLVFRVLLFHERTGSLEVIQTASDPILCTQLLGDPELCRLSLSESGPNGGGDLFILGKNLGKECRVLFRQLDDKPSLELKVEDTTSGDSHSSNSEPFVSWEKEATLEVEYSHQTHLVCRVPAYDGPSSPLISPLPVQVIIRLGQRWSNPFPFTYIPDTASLHAEAETYSLLHTSNLQAGVQGSSIDYSHPSATYLPGSTAHQSNSSSNDLHRLSSSSTPTNENTTVLAPGVPEQHAVCSLTPVSESSFFLPSDHITTAPPTSLQHPPLFPNKPVMPLLKTLSIPELHDNSASLVLNNHVAPFSQGDLSVPSRFLDVQRRRSLPWGTEPHVARHPPPSSAMY